MADMSGTPAYLQVAADLRSKIDGGVLAVGAQLPSMTQLREMYGVSNTVVRDALNDLRREGLIVGQQGKGVFVRATTGAGRARGGDTGSPEVAAIMRRLEALAAAVRGLDERMSELEKAAGQEQRSRWSAR